MNENKERERYSEPCFGMIVFQRVTSGGKNIHFYGSELPQDNYVEMKVYHSEMEKDLTNDWYFAKHNEPTVLKLRLSAMQFAELITNMNVGDGVPCTLETIEGKPIQKLQFQESRKEFVHRKFKDRMRQFAKTIKDKQTEAKELVKKKTLSKDDVQDLTHHLDWLTTELESNIPFFMECFQETMDEIVLEAKVEVENAIQHKINVLGLTELHRQNKIAGELNNNNENL